MIKTPDEVNILREGGRRLARILSAVAALVKPGVSARELDDHARALIHAGGDQPSFLNYRPAGAHRSFPAALCVSVNDAVVHGIPSDTILQEGDIVGLDLGIKHGGLFTDAALTVAVGAIDDAARALIDATRESLMHGIQAARVGNTVGDIGHAIQTFIEPLGYGIVRELAGHGVGYAVHEEPFVPNYGKAGKGIKLLPGMVLAIEPMVNEGAPHVLLGEDKFTFKTSDGSRSAHFEHTIVILEDGPAEILTNES